MSKLCGTVTMYCTHVLEYIEGLRWNMTALDVAQPQHEKNEHEVNENCDKHDCPYNKIDLQNCAEGDE